MFQKYKAAPINLKLNINSSYDSLDNFLPTTLLISNVAVL